MEPGIFNNCTRAGPAQLRAPGTGIPNPYPRPRGTNIPKPNPTTFPGFGFGGRQQSQGNLGSEHPQTELGEFWERSAGGHDLTQELFHGEIKPGISRCPEDADYPGKAQGEGRSLPESRLFPELWIGSGSSQTQLVGRGKLG